MTQEEIQQCKEELLQIEKNISDIKEKLASEYGIFFVEVPEFVPSLFEKHKERLKSMDPFLKQFVDQDILLQYS